MSTPKTPEPDKYERLPVEIPRYLIDDLLDAANLTGIPPKFMLGLALPVGLIYWRNRKRAQSLRESNEKRPISDAVKVSDVIEWPDGTASKVLRHPNGNVSLVEMNAGEADERGRSI